MPLSKRARIEIYLPSGASWGRLQTVLEAELLYTFGGCTVVAGTKGLYIAADGTRSVDSVNLIYADTPFDLDGGLDALSAYADKLKAVALEVTNEESVLIVVHEIYHSI